jgi:hypothetical protein
MRPYLITHNDFIIPDVSLRAFLDTRSEILNWYRPFIGAIIVVSQHNQTYMANMLLKQYPQKQFIITEMNAGTSDGQLFQPAWDFIRSPKPSAPALPTIGNLLNAPNYNPLIPTLTPPKKK